MAALSPLNPAPITMISKGEGEVFWVCGEAMVQAVLIYCRPW